MATVINRSRFGITVKNRDDLTAYFPFNQLPAVEACMRALRAQGFKPSVKQLDESWLVRVRTKGQKEQSATFPTLMEAEGFIKRLDEERGLGLFVDYTKSLKVSLADLIVRYLLNESPRHKSHEVTAY